MAFAVLDATTIPVAPGGSAQRPRLIADTEPAVDGTLRRQRTGVKRTWPITTKLIPRASANALYAILIAPGTHSFSGDLPGGAVTVLAEVEDWQSVPTAQGEHVRLTFKLDEV